MPTRSRARSGPPAGAPRARRAGRRPPSGDVRLRGATAADLGTLVRHRRRMWEELRDFSAPELERHDVAYRRWVRRERAAGRFFGFVAEDRSGRAVGSGAVWLMPSQPRPGVLGREEIPYILSMYTEPAARRLGIASRLVEEMIRWSKARGYGRIVLHASRFGRPVYERLGFEPGSEMRLELIRRPPSLR